MTDLPEIPFVLRRRPFLARFWRSYRVWRRFLPPMAAARAAWSMANV